MKQKSMILVALTLMTVGFATVTTTLWINGNITLSTSSDFDVIFTKAVNNGSDISSQIGDNGKSITYTTSNLATLTDESVLEFTMKNKSREYDAEVSIECTAYKEGTEEEIATNNRNFDTYLTVTPDKEKYTVVAKNKETGTITTKLKKSYFDDELRVTYKCTLVGNAKERSEAGKCIPTSTVKNNVTYIDSDCSGDTNVGDEIAIGEEHFYVISKENGTINALAKYNLNVGSNKNPNVTEGIQHETVRAFVKGLTTYGNVTFSSSNGWPYENNDTINIKDYDGPVKDALYGTNGYEKYIQKTIPDASARLITKEEIETLVNDGATLSGGSIAEKADKKGYSWIYSTSYWTQSANSGGGGYVWGVDSDGNFNLDDYSFDSYYGVRPVITIS